MFLTVELILVFDDIHSIVVGNIANTVDDNFDNL